MKFRNKTTGQILEFSSAKVTWLIQADKYAEAVPTNDFLQIEKEILLSELLKTGNFEEVTAENDWLHLDYKYRVCGNGAQLLAIVETAPEFLVELKTAPENPREKFGQHWESYVNNFAEPILQTQLWLKEIGCEIHINPTMPDLILECDEVTNLELTIE